MENNQFDKVVNRLNVIEGLVVKLVRKIDTIHPDQKLTRQQVRDTYHISFGTIHKYMKIGLLKYTRFGRRILFERSEVERFVKHIVKDYTE